MAPRPSTPARADSNFILLGPPPREVPIRILFENRSLLALDKPAGWSLGPDPGHRPSRNLQLAIERSLLFRPPWVSRRNLRFLRFIHRLDADTTGILLLAKSRGAIAPYSRLLENRRVRKSYLAAVLGTPPSPSWTCQNPLARDPRRPERMRITPRGGLDALTDFVVLRPPAPPRPALVAAFPQTGRTHQIRVHLAASGCPVVGDPLYGGRSMPDTPRSSAFPMGLRAVALGFTDPFTHRDVLILAPVDAFLAAFGWPPDTWSPASAGKPGTGGTRPGASPPLQ